MNAINHGPVDLSISSNELVVADGALLATPEEMILLGTDAELADRQDKLFSKLPMSISDAQKRLREDEAEGSMELSEKSMEITTTSSTSVIQSRATKDQNYTLTFDWKRYKYAGSTVSFDAYGVSHLNTFSRTGKTYFSQGNTFYWTVRRGPYSGWREFSGWTSWVNTPIFAYKISIG